MYLRIVDDVMCSHNGANVSYSSPGGSAGVKPPSKMQSEPPTASRICEPNF